MNNKNAAAITSADRKQPLLPAQRDVRPALVKKIGKTTYQVTINFSATSSETMSDKIMRMLRNEIQQM
ncbi:MAG: transposon-encoded TnpW family protein [Clostridiales bacterium]|nr:transposon-encoded TnpW family protein [Clostridiales bacterium]